MKKSLKKPLISLFLSIIHYPLSITSVFAQAKEWTEPTGKDPAQFKDIETIFSNIAAIIFPLGGIAVFIMLIVGGFQHLTAGGNPETSQKAWKTLTFAIIGLVLLVGIWFILRFIKEFTGVDVTKFQIIQD